MAVSVWGWGGNKRELFSVRMPLKSVRPVAVCPRDSAVPEEPSRGCSPRRGLEEHRAVRCAPNAAQRRCAGEQRALLSWQRGEPGNEEEKEKKPEPGVELKKKHNRTTKAHQLSTVTGRIRAQSGRARSALVEVGRACGRAARGEGERLSGERCGVRGAVGLEGLRLAPLSPPTP